MSASPRLRRHAGALARSAPGRRRERLAVPARAAHRALLEAARLQGWLRPEVDVEVLADALFAPIWFRLLVRRTPLSSRHAEEVADAVLEGWTTYGDARLRPASSRDRDAGDAPS